MRDYKPRTRETKRKPSGGTLIGIFIGLVLGLALAAGLALYMTNAPVPFVTRADKARATPPQADRALAETARSTDAKAGDASKPRFDFYKILPGQEVPVTENELRAAAKSPDKAAAKDLYFVQAGAFQNPADADNLKARLALAGLVASVEPANLPDKGIWYRVRLGPYTQLDEINRVRATLAQNGIDASLVRMKN
ncbi:MAG TPA: SPOR domain-containing protein [Burkholderiales bacterium]|nr:SPOR domain-containing protein [Burkholderiales bacterium]